MTNQPQTETKTYAAVLFLDPAHATPFVYLAMVEETNSYSSFYGLENKMSENGRQEYALRLWQDQNFPIMEISPENMPTVEELARTVSEYMEVKDRYLTACAGSPNPNGYIFDVTAAYLQAYTLVRYEAIHLSDDTPPQAMIDHLDKKIAALLDQLHEVR